MDRLGQLSSFLKEGIMVLLVCGLALAAIASLPAIGLLVWAWFSPGSPPACDQNASTTAPGGRYVATAISCHSTMYIGGSSTWDEVKVCASSPDARCRTVYEADGRPVIAWADDHDLTITVDGSGYLRVASSLHSAFGVIVSYKVVGKTSEEDFRKGMEDYKSKLTAQYGPKLVSEWVNDHWKAFHAFQVWAQTNKAHPER